MAEVQMAPARIDRWGVALWIVQGLLAFMYVYAGFMKTTLSPEGLVGIGWAWAMAVPAWFIVAIGVVEFLGAAGVILPAATRIMPRLTVLAASGLALLQVCAIILHAARGETAGTIGLNLVLLAAALCVAWGRLRKRPIAPR